MQRQYYVAVFFILILCHNKWQDEILYSDM